MQKFFFTFLILTRLYGIFIFYIIIIMIKGMNWKEGKHHLISLFLLNVINDFHFQHYFRILTQVLEAWLHIEGQIFDNLIVLVDNFDQMVVKPRL